MRSSLSSDVIVNQIGSTRPNQGRRDRRGDASTVTVVLNVSWSSCHLASCMTGRKVGNSIFAAHGLNVIRRTTTTHVALGR